MSESLEVTIENLFKRIDDTNLSYYTYEPTGEHKITINGHGFSVEESEVLMPFMRTWITETKELTELREIVGELAEMDAHDYSDGRCFFCQRLAFMTDETRQDHDPDCPWLRAQRWKQGEGK